MTSRAQRWALGAALLAFAALAIRLSWRAPFTVDEFQYAHASWLVAHGAVPYRDFFEVHLPLVYQWLAPLWLFLGDDPAGIVWLRLGLLPFLALTAAAAAAMNRRDGLAATVLAPLFLGACPGFIGFATQVRPDPVAFALFAGALALRYARRPGPLARGVAFGALWVGAAWASQKALFYAAPLLLGPVLDLTGSPRPRSGRAEPSVQAEPVEARFPLGFLAGALAALLPIFVYLAVTHSFGALWQWCFAWAAEHQRGYPGFSWRRYFDPAFAASPWLFAFAALGLAATARRWVAAKNRLRDPDLLLLLCVPSAFASFALQQAPYPYSLVPLLGLSAVLGARGAAVCLQWLAPVRLAWVGGLTLAVLLAAQALRLAAGETNAAQLRVLERIGQLTAPGDTAYDNSGSYVARPHAFFTFYTDAFLRTSQAGHLAREVPAALVERGCVLRVEDVRSDTLPASLRDFLAAHYQPVDGDLALWGQRYDGPGEGSFLAVKAGRYFVEPERALAGLELDGMAPQGPIFSLSSGAHTVRSRRAGPFFLLWLPRDGRRWVPSPGRPPALSRLF